MNNSILISVVKLIAGLLSFILLFSIALFFYSRITGPVALPLWLVNRLAPWESHSQYQWDGMGIVVAYMDNSDELIPGGERVKLKRPFVSRLLKGDRALLVYLPEGYDEKRDDPYPVLYTLHGFGDRCHSWVHSLLPVLEEAIESGTIPPLVVIMPDFSLTGNGLNHEDIPTDGRSGSWYINSNLGRYEDHFFQELVPFIQDHFNVRRDASGTALYGNSMGGYGALYYSMKHPGFAKTVGALYPMADLRYAVDGDRLALYDPNIYQPITTDDPKRVMMDGGVMGMLGVGEDFFIYPVFGANSSSETIWSAKTPIWKRLREVNPADILENNPPDLSAIHYYMIAGDRDEFNFAEHLKRVRPLLQAAGAKVEPENYIIQGMKHSWWLDENNIHKQNIITWLGRMLR